MLKIQLRGRPEDIVQFLRGYRVPQERNPRTRGRSRREVRKPRGRTLSLGSEVVVGTGKCTTASSESGGAVWADLEDDEPAGLIKALVASGIEAKAGGGRQVKPEHTTVANTLVPGNDCELEDVSKHPGGGVKEHASQPM